MTSTPKEPLGTLEAAREQGLTVDEWEKILGILGRTPTRTELGIFKMRPAGIPVVTGVGLPSTARCTSLQENLNDTLRVSAPGNRPASHAI